MGKIVRGFEGEDGHARDSFFRPQILRREKWSGLFSILRQKYPRNFKVRRIEVNRPTWIWIRGFSFTFLVRALNVIPFRDIGRLSNCISTYWRRRHPNLMALAAGRSQCEVSLHVARTIRSSFFLGPIALFLSEQCLSLAAFPFNRSIGFLGGESRRRLPVEKSRDGREKYAHSCSYNRDV